MSQSAFVTQYREQTIDTFEQGTSLLRNAVTTEAQIKGNSAVFQVAGSGGASAVTRGLSGLIPARQNDRNQYTATLAEWHDLVQETSFNIFASQGDGNQIMQKATMKVINRKIDSDILGELANATNDTGSATTMSLDLVMYARAILGNNDVPTGETQNMFGLLSPAAEAYLMQTPEFASADYINSKPFESSIQTYIRWAGVNWIVHPNVSGAAGAAEKLYVWHRDSIGHAANKAGMDVDVGYNGEHQYSWARCSMFMGSKLLQNSGIVLITHDGSGYAAQ